jgi:Fic family protein
MTESRSDDLALADLGYAPLLPFSAWQNCEVPIGRWDGHRKSLHDATKGVSEKHFRRALDIVKRAAAIETGAIEGLYEVDQGFTITAATGTAAFAAALEKKEHKTRAYIESQLRAYDFVLDIATQARPIAEAWIRELHQVICGEGATYSVETEVGRQERPLPLGVYKQDPNHVKLPSGAIHSYAPVNETAPEMERLVTELRSDAFAGAHPVLQAAYAHYGLVWIHPFADGNGRVARALASVFSYRAESIPILITAEQKRIYLGALRAADSGDRQTFVLFVLERFIDTMRLIEESVRAAALPTLDEVVGSLHATYITPGGYDHVLIDEAAYRLLDSFNRTLTDRLKELSSQRMRFDLRVDNEVGPGPEGFRPTLISGPRRTILRLTSLPPAELVVERAHVLYVPKRAAELDVIRIATGNAHIDVAIGDVIATSPLPLSVEMRLRIFADRVLADHLDELHRQVRKRLEKKGYG